MRRGTAKVTSLLGAAAIAVGVLSLPAPSGATVRAGAPTSPPPVERPGAAQETRSQKPRRAPVVLGLHDLEYPQVARSHLAAPGVQIPARLSCVPLMTTRKRELASLTGIYAGFPAVIAGCGSSPRSWKYSGPRMGGFLPDLDWAGAYDVLADRKTSAATPTPQAYKKYLRRVQAAVGDRIDKWEVRNEADLPAFYRGTPRDLVRLTFVAAKVFGRSRVASPSWCPCAATNPEGLSGAWVGGRYLTRGEFIDSYWRILLAQSRRRGVPLPLSVISIHAYGLGPTVGDAVRDRLMKIRTFKVNTRSILGRRMRQLELWDTEWNLRRAWPTLPKGTPGFADTKKNARAWKRSVRQAACAGVDRQYVYRWLRRSPAPDEFEYLNLPLNDRARWMTAAFRQLAGRSVRCT